MRRNAFSALIVTLAGALLSGAVRHIRSSSTDAFLECAARALGKPVLRSTFRDYPTRAIGCASNSGDLRRQVRRAGFRLFEDANAALIMPSRLFVRDAALTPAAAELLTFTWKRIRFVSKFKQWRDFAGNTTLDQDTLMSIGETVLRAARPTPYDVPYRSETDPETLTLNRVVTIDIHRGPENREFVIAIVGESTDFFSGPGRLFVGEWKNGLVTPLWDSPVFRTQDFAMGYDDLNRDGVDEIIVSSSVGSGRYEKTQMTVFDLEGNELTRQEDCDTGDIGFDESEGVCPISADKIVIDSKAVGPKSLVVAGRLEDISSATPNRVVRYELKDGRYRPVDGGTQSR